MKVDKSVLFFTVFTLLFLYGINNYCYADTATKFVITSSPFSAPQNTLSPAITAEARDNTGTKDPTCSDLAALSTSSAGGRFSVSSSPWADATAVTFSGGDATFYYKDSNTGNPFITISRPVFTPDTQMETITLLDTVTATKLVFTSSPFSIPQNTVSPQITAQAQDNTGIVDVDFNGTVTLSTSAGSGVFSVSSSPWINVNEITFSSGRGSFYYKDSNTGNPIVTVSRVGLTSNNQMETITLLDTVTATKLVFTSSPFSIPQNTVSPQITAQAQDNTGIVDVDFNGTVTLSTSAGSGVFSVSSSPWINVNIVSLSAGQTSFYYRDSNIGSPTITISRSGLISDTQTGSVRDTTPPNPPSNLTPTLLDQRRVQLDWVKSNSADVEKYNVYWDSATGTINYDTPCSYVMHPNTRWTSDSLSDTTHKLALRAVDLRQNVDQNTNVVVSVTIFETLSGIKAVIKVPGTGKKISGQRVTVIAELILGSVSQVNNIRFEYKRSDSSTWDLIPAANPNHPNPDYASPYFVHWDVSAEVNGNYDLRAVATDIYGAPDSAPAYITITIDHTDPDIEEGNNAQTDHEKKQKVETGYDNLIQVGDNDKNHITEILLPEGIVSSSTKLSVTILGSSTAPPLGAQGAFLKSAGEYRKFELQNGQTELGNTGAYVTIPYNDADNNGIVDETGIPVENLAVYYFTTVGWPHWTQLSAAINRDNKFCTFNTTHFSVFGLFGTTASNLSSVTAYPNPYKSSLGHTQISFDNLTAGTTIKIFNIAGELVWEKTDISVAKTDWDVTNKAGTKVASGVYIYLISNTAGEKVTGKLAVIK